MKIEEVTKLCAQIISETPTYGEFWPVWFMHPVDFSEARTDMLERCSQPKDSFVIGKATFFPSELCPRREIMFSKSETNPLEGK